MAWLPTPSGTLQAAWPELRGTSRHRAVAPSSKVTVPLGVAPSGTDTDAVTFTGWSTDDGFTAESMPTAGWLRVAPTV